MKTGQVIGSTNRYGEAPQERPVHLHEMFATFYHLLGIDPKTTTLTTPTAGRSIWSTWPSRSRSWLDRGSRFKVRRYEGKSERRA